MSCYDCELHQDAETEVDSFVQGGRVSDVARLVAVLMGVVRNCVSHREPVIFAKNGIQFFKRDCSGLSAIFVIRPSSTSFRSTLFILTVVDASINGLGVAVPRA